jgi:CO dehydrogenase maturation factor
MKIAFVGKGGSGKSTVSALFIKYLVTQGQKVAAVDADINQHLAEMIGADLRPELALYYGDNARELRTILQGTNQRIKSAERFVKTTPPGQGSHLIRLDDKDPIVSRYATKFSGNNYFMHTGTYDEAGIGISCYHSNLAVFENVLSHAVTGAHEWLVADMVAGTDAFAGALHVMFDAICMVVEPTPESVGVFRQFLNLAQKANVDRHVFAIGNKVMDDEDAGYLQGAIGAKLIAHLPHDNRLRKARQQGRGLERLSDEAGQQMELVKQTTQEAQPSANEQLHRLHGIHRRFAAQNSTIVKHGDLTSQIDTALRLVDNH